MTRENNNSKRMCTTLFTALVFVGSIANISCNRTSEKQANGNAANGNTSTASDPTSSTPPFPTKEPDRYQATWVTSGSGGPQSANIPGLSSFTNQQMPVARDGEKRRMETEMLPGVKIIYLQVAAGRYALYPAKKLYAEIRIDGSDNSLKSTQGVPSDFSPGKLLGGTSPAGAKYEKLGTEEINGRITTKYRVTTGGGDSSKTETESFIWADESLGMPIKVESTSKDGANFTLELRDIKLDVDPALFELPKDYRKVEHSELLSATVPSISDLLGIDGENKKTKKR